MSEIVPGDLVGPNGVMKIVSGYSYAGYDRNPRVEGSHEPASHMRSGQFGLVLARHDSLGLFTGEPDLVEALILCPDVGYAWFDIENFVKIE